MNVFPFSKLTINGITKICDDKIYFFQNKPIKYQWFTSQLLYILDILNQSNKDPLTGLYLTRSSIYKLLIELDVENISVFSKDMKKDISMGIISKKKKDTISDNNLGGNVNLNEITLGYDMQNLNYTHINLVKTKKIFKIKGKGKINWLIEKTKRVEKAYETIVKNNIFPDFGRLEWYNQSCYADSILFLLLVPIFNSGLSNFISDNFINKKLSLIGLSNTEIKKNKCIDGTTNQSLVILNNIYNTFDTVVKKLQAREIINSYKFLKELTECVKKTNNQNFINNTMNDTLEFMTTLFSVYNINYIDYNKMVTYKYFDIPQTNYSSSIDNIFLEKVTGEDLKEEINNDNDVLFKHIFENDLTDILKLNIKGGLTHEEIETTSLVKKEYYYDTVLELWFPQKHKALYAIKKNKNIISISKFIKHKREFYPENSYHVYDGYKKIVEDNIDYIVSLDGAEKHKLTQLPKVNDKAIKIEKYINEFIINNASTLFLGIHRKKTVLDKDKKQTNVVIPIKILPETTIIVNFKTLFIRGIIVWYNNHYITFFCKDEVWYKYDDSYNFSINNDYITVIGGLDELLIYSIDSIKNIVLTNSVMYWYNI